MTEAILDAIIDSIKILPFLFITYLIMEYLEHKTSEKSKTSIESRPFAPCLQAQHEIFSLSRQRKFGDCYGLFSSVASENGRHHRAG